MSASGPYGVMHSPQFTFQLCGDIRAGALGRRDAQQKHSLSTNLVQLWLMPFDNGKLTGEEVEAAMVVDYETRIAARERKVDQFTMELDLFKKSRTCVS